MWACTQFVGADNHLKRKNARKVHNLEAASRSVNILHRKLDDLLFVRLLLIELISRIKCF